MLSSSDPLSQETHDAFILRPPLAQETHDAFILRPPLSQESHDAFLRSRLVIV
jgi:hypothetical protein